MRRWGRRKFLTLLWRVCRLVYPHACTAACMFVAWVYQACQKTRRHKNHQKHKEVVRVQQHQRVILSQNRQGVAFSYLLLTESWLMTFWSSSMMGHQCAVFCMRWIFMVACLLGACYAGYVRHKLTNQAILFLHLGFDKGDSKSRFTSSSGIP